MRGGAGGARWSKGTRGPCDRWGWHSGKGGSDRCRPAPSPTCLYPPPAFRAPFNTAATFASHLRGSPPFRSHPPLPSKSPCGVSRPEDSASPPYRRFPRLSSSRHPHFHSSPHSAPNLWRGMGTHRVRPGSGAGDGGRGRPVPWMSHPLSRSGSPGSRPGEMAQRMEPQGRALEAGGREGEAAPPHALHTPTLLRPRGRRGGG